MKAIVLAAGEGKRMRPLTANRPKVLLPAGPEPLLHRLLRQLASAGVDDVSVVTHAHADVVSASIGHGSAWGLRIKTVPQGEPRGTGHAVAAAAPPQDAPFLIVNGDVWLPEGTLERIVKAGPGSLGAARVKDARPYGVFEVQQGNAVRVVEKSETPVSDLVNGGVYHAPAGFARHLPSLKPSPRGELELTDALQASFDETGGWTIVEITDWLDVGRPWDLLEAAQRTLADAVEVRAGRIEAGAMLHGKVSVGQGTLIKAGSYIEGPVHIGRDCTIGPNCYIRPNTVILDGCKVGNACEVKASILMNGTHVGHLSYVGDSVLGERVNFGAGTVVANLRHDGKPIKVTHMGQRVDTGRRKLGVIVGDDVHTGIHTSLNLGVMLPAGASTRPGEVVMQTRV